LLFWNAPSKSNADISASVGFLCFNPCCFGMRPRRAFTMPGKMGIFSFNPCCFGMRPRRPYCDNSQKILTCFNPCCFGMRPRRAEISLDRRRIAVSILVVLECALEV